jgi:hypothetical protein
VAIIVYNITRLGCDEDKERFEANLGKIAKAKPIDGPVKRKR